MSNSCERNWFETGGSEYSKYRPKYPSSLVSYLTKLAPETELAVDVGCGTGQLTKLLANTFNTVMGFDPSNDQLANADPDPHITYQCAPAEELPIENSCASLVTAAQAAHWFNLHEFYQEVRRITLPGGILALISYGVLSLEPHLDNMFQEFYWNDLSPYWPPERTLVDTGYASIEFPFEELHPPSFEIRVQWDLPELFGYLLTWSAIRKAREAGKQNFLQKFTEDLSKAWGDDNVQRTIVWPINMRVGKVNPD